jgi:AcrR family transcriptional regulator
MTKIKRQRVMPANKARAKQVPPDHLRRRGEPPSAHVETGLLSAIERLLRDGRRFGALSVEELAREAGIGRATFYLYFRNKGELITHLMQQLTREVEVSAGDWFRDAGEVDHQTLRQALHGIVGTFRRHQGILAAASDTAATDPQIETAYRAMMDRLCQLSRQAVRQVNHSGRGTGVDPDRLADLLTWFIALYCARFIADHDDAEIARLIDLFVHVAGRSIFQDPAAASS